MTWHRPLPEPMLTRFTDPFMCTGGDEFQMSKSWTVFDNDWELNWQRMSLFDTWRPEQYSPHYQTHYLEWQPPVLISLHLSMLQGFNGQWHIGSGIGLSPIRRHGITWTDDARDLRRLISCISETRTIYAHMWKQAEQRTKKYRFSSTAELSHVFTWLVDTKAVSLIIHWKVWYAWNKNQCANGLSTPVPPYIV